MLFSTILIPTNSAPGQLSTPAGAVVLVVLLAADHATDLSSAMGGAAAKVASKVVHVDTLEVAAPEAVGVLLAFGELRVGGVTVHDLGGGAIGGGRKRDGGGRQGEEGAQL